MGLFGKRQERSEDDKLIVGRGQYVDDIKLPGMLHVAIVRSQAARARIKVDVRAAAQSPGVIAVFTADRSRTANTTAMASPNQGLT